MPETPIISPATIHNLRALSPDDNDEFLREIVGIFELDTPERLAELEKALADADNKTFARAAHSIKGSSANVGAMKLHALAQELEAMASVGDKKAMQASLLRARSEFAQATAELHRITQSAPNS